LGLIWPNLACLSWLIRGPNLALSVLIRGIATGHPFLNSFSEIAHQMSGLAANDNAIA